MSKSRLICTVELDLPDNLAEANRAQAPLLEMWGQFTSALPEQGIKDARVDARIVKSKEAKAKSEPVPQPVPQPVASQQMPEFLKRV